MARQPDAQEDPRMFITHKIHIAPVSMEEAVAKAQAKTDPRPLDDILASIAAENNKQVKTASAGKSRKNGGSCT